MTCAYKTYPSSTVIPAPTRVGAGRPRFLKVLIGAFQEALTMRRAAQRIYFLGDE